MSANNVAGVLSFVKMPETKKSPFCEILNTNSKNKISNREDLFFASNAYTTPFEDELAIYYPENFIEKYANQDVLSLAFKSNPNIKEILSENNLPCKFNINNVNSIIKSHLCPVAKQAQNIYLGAGNNKNEINYTRLTQAALLHDIGKVFIPEEILNKKGRLNAFERKIVELHNLLSYEILKTTNLHPSVAKFALEHHNYDNKIKKTKENQALMVADIYCALREKRPYKKPMNDLMAKIILYDMASNGKFDSSYINYIKPAKISV